MWSQKYDWNGLTIWWPKHTRWSRHSEHDPTWAGVPWQLELFLPTHSLLNSLWAQISQLTFKPLFYLCIPLMPYFANKGPSSQSCGFSSGHVWIWDLDYKESWVPKNWCFWTVVLEKTLESPLDYKEIQPVHPKGNQSWIFIGSTDAEAETPILWSPGVKTWLIGKRPWCWERLKIGGEGNNRWWDGWMASPTQWTWVWVNSGSWQWNGRPGLLQFMGTQSWTQLSDWTELNWCL